VATRAIPQRIVSRLWTFVSKPTHPPVGALESGFPQQLALISTTPFYVSAVMAIVKNRDLHKFDTRRG
jgi:hypothetical protein